MQITFLGTWQRDSRVRNYDFCISTQEVTSSAHFAHGVVDSHRVVVHKAAEVIRLMQVLTVRPVNNISTCYSSFISS